MLFATRGRLPLVRQTEAAECGLACLAMIAGYHGHRIDLNSLRRRYPASLNGASLRSLIRIATHLDLLARPIRFEMEHLANLQRPAILHWDMTHFVVLKSVSQKGLVVHDPAAGERFYTLAEAGKRLTGVALELTPAEGFARKDERVRLPLGSFIGQLQGSGHALVQVIVLSAVLELLTIAAPFYMQLTFDEVIARGDVDLLLVLALGFGLLMLIRAATSAIRGLILLIVQNVLQFRLGARLFRHLIRLPMAFFEARHIGDLLSRFSSLQPVRSLLAEGLIAALLDGSMAVVTLAMMFVYSRTLGAVVVTAILVYGAIRIALYRVLWRRTEATILAQAQENSVFIESVRAIQSLKLFNRESEREAQWLNRFSDVVSANVRLGRAKLAFDACNQIVFGLENIVVVYMAARLALANELSVGMIFAFMSYKQSFEDKAIQLVEKALEARLLGLHLERIADIALSELERGHDRPLAYARDLTGRIELRGVSFRYSESDPLVLEDINLVIEPGEFVTIKGPSGGGKTTLVKLMLGLLEPTSGEVLIDGVPLQTLGARAYREQIGAVMQDDQLISGSIADNICFLSPDFDRERMIACARLAGIYDEIMAMPMTFNSLVGDMGSSLSGGQKQRVILARALYKEPRILFLDEGTAHLDPENERRINESLVRMRMTRISVAHRPDISVGANRVLVVARTLLAEQRAARPGDFAKAFPAPPPCVAPSGARV